jgi:hypothetical protein
MFCHWQARKWLCEQKYLEAVKLQYIAKETQKRGSYRKHITCWPNGHTTILEDRLVESTTGSNMETTILPTTVQRNEFYCPDAKYGKSSEGYCRSCTGWVRAQGTPGVGGWRTENELIWCIVQKEIVFDHDLCVNAFREL